MLKNERPEGDRNPEFDSEASLREAKRVLPLTKLMEQHGDKPPGEKWGKCPFCEKKSTARIKASGDQEFFKCANDNCPSATSGEGNAWTEIHYLKFKTGFNQKDAFVAYLKEAGVWKERTKFKGLPKTGSEAAAPGNGTPKAAEDGRGPESGSDTTKSLQSDAAVESDEGKIGIQNDPAKSAGEKPAEGAAGQTPGATAASEAKPGVGVPDTSAGTGSGGVPLADLFKPADSNLPGPTTGHLPNDAALAGANNAEAAPLQNFSGPVAPSGPVISKPAAAKVEPPVKPDGWRSLREFFQRLTLSNADRDNLFDKRGLKWLSSHALRFRSNPRTNEAILIELKQKYGLVEMLASGLWLPADRKHSLPPRPNPQFYGKGIKGKRAKKDRKDADDKVIWGWTYPVLIPYYDETGELIGLRPHKGMGRGETLVGTPQVYIPRGAGGPKDGAHEVFYTVVITEGEFKAAALWQSLGVWRTDGNHPIGVAALPGITFARNYEIREVLEDWLRRVKCHEVIVVYDNEEKGDPKLESYIQDRHDRFDAQKYARFLATSLHNKLHIRGTVGMLPDSWRNAKGKADWDGAACDLAKGKILEAAK